MYKKVIFGIMAFLFVNLALFAQKKVELGQIVITPYRYNEEINFTPATVTVMTQNELANSNVTTVLDALRTIPGITVRDWLGNTSKASIDIRGFGEQAGLNSVVLIDGRRINEVDLSGVDWSQIPLDQVSRIEILRGGGGSVLYGDNAVAGVVNIITKKGEGNLQLHFGSQYGSYDMNSQKLSLSGSNNKLSYWLSLSRYGTHGYRKNSYFKTQDFASKFEWTFLDSLNLHLSSGYHKSSYGMPGPLSLSDIDNFGRRYSKYGDDHTDDKDYYFDVGIDKDFGNWGKLSIDTSYRKRDFYSSFIGSNAGWNPFIRSYIETYSFTPKYTVRRDIFSHSNKFIAGIDIYRYDYNSDTYNISDILQNYTDINKITLGFYFQNEFSIFKRLKLVSGYRKETARYDFDYHDNSGFNPDVDTESKPHQKAYNFGLVYNYADNSSVFFNASRSFRFPATDEYFTWGSLNLNLKPQESYNYEVGARYQFKPALRCNISLFRMNLKNELYYNPIGGPWGFGANENYDKTRREGFEFSIDSKVNELINLIVNYTYTKATFRGGLYNDKTIPMVPHNKASLKIKLSLFNNLKINVTTNYIGSRYFINDQANNYKRLGGHFTADINLSYFYKEWTFLFGVNNIFDKEYSEYGVCNPTSGAKNYYPSPARNFLLKIAYKF